VTWDADGSGNADRGRAVFELADVAAAAAGSNAGAASTARLTTVAKDRALIPSVAGRRLTDRQGSRVWYAEC
jgi:hypothetical protein